MAVGSVPAAAEKDEKGGDGKVASQYFSLVSTGVDGMSILPGMRIKLVDMEDPRLNGKYACILHTNAEENEHKTWTVRLTDGTAQVLEVRASNIAPAPVPGLSTRISMMTELESSGRSREVSPPISDSGEARSNPEIRVAPDAKPSSSFIKTEQEQDPIEAMSPFRAAVAGFMNSTHVESGIGILILFNFFLICIETDSRAVYPGRHAAEEPPDWVMTAMDVIFGFFVLELLVRLYVAQRRFFRSTWNCLDTLIVVLGGTEQAIKYVWEGVSGIGIIRIVRLCRLLRLLRVMRLFAVLKELRRLLQMMGSCFKTLFWSFLLLLLVMTIWALIAVEVLNPLVQQVADRTQAWEGCERCRRAFSSTFMANITFFQTVVAGDSWGFMAIPVIEEYPGAALIFVGALLTLVFGVLNLIVAVIVDTFAENRDKDVVSRAADMDVEEVEEKKVLAKIFEKIDADGGGTLSYEELQDGARRVAEFRHWLRVMDIDARDLRQLFLIVDEDESGEIDPDEFIEAMYRMKNTESKTATKFVKHLVTKLDQEQQALRSDIGTGLATITSDLEKTRQDAERAVELAATERDALNVQKEYIQQRFREQEEAIQKSIELAMNKASEVALEAALSAATLAAKDVMSTVSLKSAALAQGVHSRMAFQRQVSPDSSISSPLPRFLRRSRSASGVSDGITSSILAVAADVPGQEEVEEREAADISEEEEAPQTTADGRTDMAPFSGYGGPRGAPSSDKVGVFQPGGFQERPQAPRQVEL